MEVRFSKVSSFLAIALVAAGVGACERGATGVQNGRDATSSSEVSAYRLPASQSSRQFFAGLYAAQENSLAMRFENTLSELMPNQNIVVVGNPDYKKQVGVVVGTVVEVLPGMGYHVPGEGVLADAESATAIPFDDRRAQWKIARVRIAVDASYGLADARGEVTVGAFLTGKDFDTQLRGLAGLGRIVVAIDTSRGYSWDPDVYYVARGGGLFGDIDEDGQVGFPALAEESADFVGELRTAEAIERDARGVKPDIEVRIDRESGQVIRTVRAD